MGIKIGVLIPDRGDRPKLLENCLRMIAAQTLQPMIIELVNDAPLNSDCDITRRYRIGYERLRNKGLDIIALMENDDWYHPTYLETMVKEWIANGKPDIIGNTFTTYYHIKLFAHFNMHHNTRSSAMNTLIKPNLNFKWCVDKEPYTDLHLWLHCNLKKHVFKPEKYICLGIKHGEGLCGGRSHIDKFERYINKDNDKSFLKKIMDQESFNFYTNYFNHAI